MKCQRFLSIPVFSVFLLMGFIYYYTLFIFIEDWVGLQSSAGTLNALIFTWMASLCVFSFFVCVLTDPGHVSSSFVPDIEGNDAPDQESQNNDHHCLWINNCVGYWNYKAFFILVLYATVASFHSLVIIICSAFQENWDFHIYLITHNVTSTEVDLTFYSNWVAMRNFRVGLQFSSIKNIFKIQWRNYITKRLRWLCVVINKHNGGCYST
ncbi:hypothetical protein P3X46_025360 [Hevea brasiliensis]|uniref:S-acyltransferase n=1 Tax=Hevea brasiliensis TaxID=3981 RepID=A0ABQ9L6E9_HEVBR|nr:hypothetical protein P3X46_025360 [Hevea brasiliensis]